MKKKTKIEFPLGFENSEISEAFRDEIKIVDDEKVIKITMEHPMQGKDGMMLTKKQLSEPYAEPVRTEPKIGRNEPCACGSGKKYKKCCG